MSLFPDITHANASDSFFTQTQTGPVYNFRGGYYNRPVFRGPLEDEGANCVSYEDLLPLHVIRRGSDYQIQSAQLQGRVVLLKVLRGAMAEQRHQGTVSFHRRHIHPNLLHMKAVSPHNADTRFIVFYRAFCQAEDRIASVLRETRKDRDFSRVAFLHRKLVLGLSSGLDYLDCSSVPLQNIGIDDYEIFLDDFNDLAISFDPVSINNINVHSGTTERSDNLVAVLDALCQKTFKAVNKSLYGDQLENGDDPGELPCMEHTPSPQLIDSEASVSDSAEAVESTSTLRLEIDWRAVEGSGVKLEDIASEFEHSFRRIEPKITKPLFQRYLRPNSHKILHRCHGYTREKIQLTARLSTIPILVYKAPSPGEKCIVCGNLVQDKGAFGCLCGQADDGVQSTLHCNSCLLWYHTRCVTPAHLTSEFVCQNCTSLSGVKPASSSPVSDYLRSRRVFFPSSDQLINLIVPSPGHSSQAAFGGIDTGAVVKGPRVVQDVPAAKGRRMPGQQGRFMCPFPGCRRKFSTFPGQLCSHNMERISS